MIKRPYSGVGGIERTIGSGYLQRYFDSSALTSIAEAHGNEAKQFDIYKEVLTRFEFPESFWSESYKGAIQNFMEQLESLNAEIVEAVSCERLGIQHGVPQPEPPQRPKGIITGGHAEPTSVKKKSLTQKNQTGKTYNRTVFTGAHYRWLPSQKGLIQLYKGRVNMGLITPKQAIKSISDITGRTRKASQSKYYRTPLGAQQ